MEPDQELKDKLKRRLTAAEPERESFEHEAPSTMHEAASVTAARKAELARMTEARRSFGGQEDTPSPPRYSTTALDVAEDLAIREAELVSIAEVGTAARALSAAEELARLQLHQAQLSSRSSASRDLRASSRVAAVNENAAEIDTAASKLLATDNAYEAHSADGLGSAPYNSPRGSSSTARKPTGERGAAGDVAAGTATNIPTTPIASPQPSCCFSMESPAVSRSQSPAPATELPPFPGPATASSDDAQSRSLPRPRADSADGCRAEAPDWWEPDQEEEQGDELQYEWQFELLNSLPHDRAVAFIAQLRKSEQERAEVKALASKVQRRNSELEQHLEVTAAVLRARDPEAAEALEKALRTRSCCRRLWRWLGRLILLVFVTALVGVACFAPRDSFERLWKGSQVSVQTNIQDRARSHFSAPSSSERVRGSVLSNVMARKTCSTISGDITGDLLKGEPEELQVANLDECRTLCESKPECRCYAFDANRGNACWFKTNPCGSPHVWSGGNGIGSATMMSGVCQVAHVGDFDIARALEVSRPGHVDTARSFEAADTDVQCQKVKETTVREMTLRETTTREYDRVVAKLEQENHEMKGQLERLWTDVNDAIDKGQDMVCWKV